MLIRFYKRRIKKLRKLAVQPDVDLWALDEVHFQQHGSRCRMWVPPEVREPVLLHAPTRKSVGYFGAVGGRIKTSQLGSNQNQPLFSYKPFEDVLARG